MACSRRCAIRYCGIFWLVFILLIIVFAGGCIKGSSTVTPAAANGMGRTFYVSPSGNDLNDGLTLNTAWKSINNGDVKGLLGPGDTVVIKAGTYAPSVSIDGVFCIPLVNCSGSTSDPLIYKADGGVVISGAGVSGLTGGLFVRGDWNGKMHDIVLDGFEVTNTKLGILVSNKSPHIKVKNCIIHDLVRGAFFTCAGLYTEWTDDCEFTDNIIYNIDGAGGPGTGVSIRWSNNNLY
ncbi:MAG: right-handed parallel beta-helix repeat-containing protein, partial [Armatimonadota bacterium]